MSEAVWFPKGVNKTEVGLGRSVNNLSEKARKAMLGAIEKFGTIARGTWDGCAWNAACEVMGISNVGSSRQASEVFPDDSSGSISEFIHYWDKLPGTDEEATALLREYLIEGFKQSTGDIVVVVHESEETKLNKEFQSLVDSLDISADGKTEDQQEFAEDVAAVAGIFAPA